MSWAAGPVLRPGAPAVYTVIMLVRRERMQFRGHLPAPSRRDESDDDQSQVYGADA